MRLQIQEFLKQILQHCEIGQFSTIQLTSLEELIGYSQKFYHRCIFIRGSPHYILEDIQIWSPYPDLDRIHLGGGMHSHSALVSHVKVFIVGFQYYASRRLFR